MSRRVLSFFAVVFFVFSVSAVRLPVVGEDNESWGEILNTFLNVSMSPTGNLWPDIVNNTYIADGTIRNEEIASDAQISLSKIENLTNKINLDVNNLTNFLFNYNQTTSAISYVDSVILRYYNRSEIESFGYVNSSQVQAYNDTNLILGVNGSLTSAINEINSANSSFNQSLTNSLYSSIVWGYNQTISSINYFNSIISNYYNTTVLDSFGYVNSSQVQAYNDTNLILSINSSLSSSLNNLSSGNSSFNQTLTNSLYASIVLGYNQTSASISYFNGVILNYINSTQIQSSYYNKTEISALAFVNLSQIQTYNDTALILSVNSSLASSIGNVSSGNFSFNQTLTNSLYASINWSYNQTAAANSYTDALLSNLSVNVSLSNNSVRTEHVVDGTIRGADINASTNVTFYKVNATVFEIGIETKSAECSSNNCVATATCSSGSVVLIGFGSTTTLSSGLSPSAADVDCTSGLSSCSVTENQLLTNVASVKIICARVR